MPGGLRSSSTSLFDLLDDDLVQEIILRIPSTWTDPQPVPHWRALASSCRRLCELVRSTCNVKLITDAEGVLQLHKAPSGGWFSNVLVLELTYGDPTDLQQWRQYGTAAAAAVATWPCLLDMRLTPSAADERQKGSEPGCMSSTLLALSAAPALRRLTLDLPDRYSLAYVATLTQLTYLELNSWQQSVVVPHAHHHIPLAELSGLVELTLRNMSIDHGYSGPGVLPPNITRLEMYHCWDDGEWWWSHIARCPALRELHLEGAMGDANTHPTLLLQSLAACGVTDLVDLTVRRRGVDQQSRWHLGEVIPHMLDIEGNLGEEEPLGDWWPMPPLGQAQGYMDPEAYVMVPPPNMGALSKLRNLDLTNWWLVVSSERYWRALAGCTSLRSLSGLHASVAPPAGVTFPGVTRLEVTTSTSPGDTVTLLGAFPALRELQLTVVPQSTDASQVAATAGVALPALESAIIEFMEPEDVPSSEHVQCMATYCTALWGPIRNIVLLSLHWRSRVQLLPELPDISPLQKLQLLCIGNPQDSDTTVEVEQVVQLLRGAQQLKVLFLSQELAPGSTQEDLQAALRKAFPKPPSVVGMQKLAQDMLALNVSKLESMLYKRERACTT